MAVDPFAFHASPVGTAQASPWSLASLATPQTVEGAGNHDLVDPLHGHGTVTPPATTTPAAPAATPVYGAGFGSLDQDFGLKQFQTDPGYQWRMDQGIQALDRSASARGLLFSGGELKALDRYNQGFASNEYQNAFNRYTTQQGNRFNRLAALAGIGQASQNQMTGYANNLGYQLGSNFNTIGNAGAYGALGVGTANVNALNGIGGGLTNAWNYYTANRQPSGGNPQIPDNSGTGADWWQNWDPNGSGYSNPNG